MPPLETILLSSPGKLGTAAGTIAFAQNAASGKIAVSDFAYSILAVVLSLVGVWIARIITIREEDKRLGHKQGNYETAPETWLAILLVGPGVWHFQISVPVAVLTGIGVGYTIKLLLKIIGRGTVAAAKAAIRQGVETLKDVPGVDEKDDEMSAQFDKLNDL